MGKDVKPYRIIIIEAATFFVSIAAYFVLDRIYEVTYKNYWAGIFGRANNSVWEQTKIVFFAFLIFSFIELFVLRLSFIKFFVAKTSGLLFITLAVPGFLYGYSGAFGINMKIIDMIGAAFILFYSYVISCKIIINKKDNKKIVIAYLSFAIMLTCFITLSAYAPNLPFFKDPKTGSAGFDNHHIYVSNNTFFT